MRGSIQDQAVPGWLPPSVCGAGGRPPLRTTPIEWGGDSVRRRGLRQASPDRSLPDPSTSRPSLWRAPPSSPSSPAITPILTPSLFYRPAPPPRRTRCGGTCPVLGLRRTIRARTPTCLLPLCVFHPHSCVSSSTTTCAHWSVPPPLRCRPVIEWHWRQRHGLPCPPSLPAAAAANRCRGRFHSSPISCAHQPP